MNSFTTVEPMHSSPTRDTEVLIMKPIAAPPNVKMKLEQEEVRRPWIQVSESFSSDSSRVSGGGSRVIKSKDCRFGLRFKQQRSLSEPTTNPPQLLFSVRVRA